MNVFKTQIDDLKLIKRGKVRDIYEFGDNLLIVASDRISCFDSVLPTPITGKGKILTKISLFWFTYLKEIIDNHIIFSTISELPSHLQKYEDTLKDRFVVVRKAQVIPFECVVRGYLSGSGWKEYREKQSICAIALPADLKESDKLPEPIFTPATKAEVGHDENVDFNYMQNKIDKNLAQKIKELSLKIYKKASLYAESKGIIIADTKFEFGMVGDSLILIDEVLTPDSSRFWPKNLYKPGGAQASFDKQFVRDYLVESGWDKNPPAPNLPADIVEKTISKYKEALEALTKDS